MYIALHILQLDIYIYISITKKNNVQGSHKKYIHYVHNIVTHITYNIDIYVSIYVKVRTYACMHFLFIHLDKHA